MSIQDLANENMRTQFPLPAVSAAPLWTPKSTEEYLTDLISDVFRPAIKKSLTTYAGGYVSDQAVIEVPFGPGVPETVLGSTPFGDGEIDWLATLESAQRIENGYRVVYSVERR